ncbi:39S ribosomal protein L9, mitochondrial, partial [Eschrichtius robustus]|nr:39S ribosomal protein L9, mitochondrial [Eschrichtius robustus]
GTVIVERWWKVPLAGEGRKPRLHRRHRVYKLAEDTKHRPKDNLELILTQSVEELGVRGDLVSVKKSVGRNRLLPQGLAVYASPENRKLFEEEKLLRQEGKLEKIQTKAGETVSRNIENLYSLVTYKVTNLFLKDFLISLRSSDFKHKAANLSTLLCTSQGHGLSLNPPKKI